MQFEDVHFLFELLNKRIEMERSSGLLEACEAYVGVLFRNRKRTLLLRFDARTHPETNGLESL